MTKYLITFERATAKFEVVFNAGKFVRMKLLSGKLEPLQWQWVMKVVPQFEKELNALQTTYKGKVNYEVKTEQKSTYSTAMSLYHSFYLNCAGMEPRINAVEGKALKDILAYLKQLGGNDTVAVELLTQVFSGWSKLDMFYANQIELRQINKNLPAILRTIKEHGNPTKGRANSHGESIRENL